MLSDLAVSPTGEIRTSCSKTQRSCPRAWLFVRLSRCPVSACRASKPEYTRAFREAGAGSDSVNSTAAIFSMNLSSCSLAMVPPPAELLPSPSQQTFNRFLCFACFLRHLARRGLIPITPDQCEAILVGNLSQHLPRFLATFGLLKKVVNIRCCYWGHWDLIGIVDRFRGTQPRAIVVLDLVACDAHNPSLERTRSTVAPEVFPC